MGLWRFLRSRRLAVWLLVGITGYIALSTLAPLSRAFANPFFLAAAALVTASTAVCAWERSADAVRSWRRARDSFPANAQVVAPAALLTFGVDDALDEQTVLTAVGCALRRLRMQVREDKSRLAASGGRFGLLGSPLFHWAIVGVFVFAALGQLTRYEGVAEVSLGESFVDAAESYGSDFSAGPLAGDSFSGDEITFKDLDFNLVVDGVSRNESPWVTLSRTGEVVVAQYVYPNNPLRYGPVLIHHVKTAPILLATVRFDKTGGEQKVAARYEFGRPEAKQFDVKDPTTGETITLRVVPVGGERIAVTAVGASDAQTSTVGQGEVATLDGVALTPDALTYYTQLRVVRDWSVPWIYAMFLLGSVGVAVTVFVLPRNVIVRIADAEARPGTRALLVSVTAAKTDPAFRGRVQRAVEAALAECSGFSESEDEST